MAAIFPFCFSLISDSFHPKFRARASTIYSLGIYFGFALSSISLNLVHWIGWRNTFRLISGVSLLSCFQILVLKEPKRGRFDTSFQKELAKRSEGKVWLNLKQILSSSCFIFIICGSALRFMGGYSIGFWGAKFFQGKFGEDHESEYSIINGLNSLCVGLIAAYSGGYIGDKLEKRYVMTKGLLCACCPLAAFPFVFFSFSVFQSFYWAMAFYGFSYIFAEMWYGPCVSMFLTIFPSNLSGMCISIF